MSKIYQIIENFFKKDHPEEIRRSFTRWFFSSSAKEKDEALFQIWEDLQVRSDASTEQSFRNIERRLGFADRKKINILFRKWGQAAAVFLVPLLSVWFSWQYVQNHATEEAVWVECFVPAGEIRTVILPDHSEVMVNSGSSLLYPAEFNGKNRNIYLSGEAKFTVSPNKKKPFIVKTQDMSVEALGTVFNVSSYPDNKMAAASLVEGKVKVDINSGNESFILSPEEQIVYDRETGQSEHKRVRLDYVLAWEKGQMVFQSVSLYTVIKEIERNHGVTIYLNSKGLKDERLTVKFLHDETLEEVFYTLQQIIAGFKYKIEGDKVYIY